MGVSRFIMVNITQINAGKRLTAWAHLVSQLENGPRVPLVVLMQEQHNKKLPNGYSYFVENKNGPRSRAQIFIDKNFADSTGCMLLQQFSDEDQVAVALSIKLRSGGSVRCVLSSAYFPCERNKHEMIHEKLKKLVKYCNEENIELILGADVNAHSTDFGGRYTDAKGEAFTEFCLENNLFLANKGNISTFVRSGDNGPQSIIDLTVVTEKMLGLISDWEVCTEHAGSDHRQIHFSIDAPTPDNIMTRAKRRTNWKSFQRQLEMLELTMNLPDTLDSHQLDQAALRFNDILLKAYENSSKIVKKHIRYKQCWFTAKLEEKRAEVNRLKRVADSSKTILNRGKYIKAKNEYKKAIKAAKREDFRKTVEKLAGVKDYAKLHKFFEQGSVKQICAVETDDGKFTRSIDETLKVLMEKHFPNCIPIVENEDFNPSPPVRQRSTKEIKEILFCTELPKIKSAIGSFSPFKSPGDDGIFPALLQKAKDSVSPILQKMFRASLLLGYTPIAWRGATVTFIPKAGKDCYRKPGAYRPISLMSFILKTLEKLIDKKIRNVDLADNPLCSTQHAYQPGKGTESALHNFVNATEKAIQMKNGGSLCAFIDLQAAFDSLPTETILKSAREKGISEWAIDWIESVLTSRRARPSVGDLKAIKPTQGTPQGSAISPTLFCLAIDPLLLELKKQHIDTIVFADDICLMVSGNLGFDSLFDRMNKGMKIVQKWCESSGLKVNTEKTQLVMFTRTRFDYKNTKFQVTYGGKKIELVDKIKYLGITFDRKLTMNDHIDNTIAKANRALWAASAYSGNKWGPWPHVLKYVYESIILARIFYGALFYWHKISGWLKGNCERSKKINSIHRRACLLISGAFRSTPQASLNAILQLQPIEIGLTLRALEAYNRLKQSGNWKGGEGRTGHTEIAKFARIKGAEIEHDLIPVAWNYEKRFTVKKTSTTAPINALLGFSDASVKDSRAGVGFCTSNPSLEGSRRLSDHTNSNTAEMMAIKALSDHLLSVNTVDRKIMLYTDSTECLRKLDSECSDSKTTKTTIESLNKLASRNLTTEIVWIAKAEKALLHKRADALSKSARLKPIIELPSWPGKESLDKTLLHIKKQEAQKFWDGFEIPDSKQMIAGPFDERLKKLPKVSKQDMRLLTAALTNHAALKKNLFYMKKVDDPKCRFCKSGKLEDMKHVLFECENADFKNERLQNFGSMVIPLQDRCKLNLISIIVYLKRIGIKEALAWIPP